LSITFPIYLPEGIHEEYTVVSNGEMKELNFFPFKMFHLDIKNEEGPDEAKVMVNDQPLHKAVTLGKGEGRQYDAKHPKYWRVQVYTEPGKTATVKIVTTR